MPDRTNSPQEPRPPVGTDPPAQDPGAPRRWASDTLLGPAREALIDHRGALYRLRLTAAGKLILVK